jgi:hypothetical protein
MTPHHRKVESYDLDYRDALAIVGAVYRLAAKDARRGCPEAREWLMDVAPEFYAALLKPPPFTAKHQQKLARRAAKAAAKTVNTS